MEKEKEAIKEIVEKPEVTTMFVNIQRLNIRDKADIRSNILHVANRDDELQVTDLQENNKWAQVVTVAGIEGFAMTEFLRKE